MSRPKLPKASETELLVRSRRRCALCFGLHLSTAPTKGQIAHVDRDPANNAAANLAWLCLAHHDEYDSRPSQSKGFTSQELIAYRDDLYAFNEAARASIAPSQAYARLSAEGLVLARLLNESSANGYKLDPQVRIDALPQRTGLSQEDVELAVDELRSSGLLEVNGSRDVVFATNRLFWETDPLFTESDPTIDAQALARWMVNQQEDAADMRRVGEELGWTPRRLNPAATYLAETGHAQDRQALGTAPFFMFQIVRTTATKRFVRSVDRSSA